MNAILLAAGYGTRLYPLTRDRAKPLLEVGGRPIIDYLVEKLDGADVIERLVLVSNDRFIGDFREWADRRSFRKPVTVLNDGSTCNQDRRGAVGDVRFALKEADIDEEPAYVLATDNLPRFNLLDIIDLHQDRDASAVFTCPVPDPEERRRLGIAQVDEEGRVVDFQEKPDEPKGHLRVPPFYAYTAEAAGLVRRFIEQGNDPDAPGHFLAWLVERRPVYAAHRPEGTYDIGTLESYRRVQAEFERDARN